MWRDLVFAVPFKSMNYTQLAQRAVDPYRLQNMAHNAGTFGSAMDSVGADIKSFAHYRGGIRTNIQFNLLHEDSWTIAWAQHPTTLDGGGHPTGVTAWWWLSSAADDYYTPLSSWYIMQPSLTWNLRLAMLVFEGGVGVWKHLSWPMGFEYIITWKLSPHTWLLRKYPGLKEVELSIDGRILGTRTYTGDLIYPGAYSDFPPHGNLGMCIGAGSANPAGIGPSIKGRWDAVCTWKRCLDDDDVQKWHGNPLNMFTPARRRMPTPPLEVVLPPEPGRPCDWFDPRTGLPWLDDSTGEDWQAARAGSDWYDAAAAQGWLQSNGGQAWLQSSAGQDWLDVAAGEAWLQSSAGQAWLRTKAGQAWSAAAGGADWYDDEADGDWYDRRRCS